MATLTADRRLYVTADRSEIVEESDPRGAFLLVAEGLNIGEGDVAKYSLRMVDGKVAWPAATKQVPEPADKMVTAPEDKAVDEVNATGAAIEFADEHGLDLSDVEGSGKGGRIVLSDVEALIEEE